MSANGSREFSSRTIYVLLIMFLIMQVGSAGRKKDQDNAPPSSAPTTSQKGTAGKKPVPVLDANNIPTDMPAEHRQMIQEQYEKFMQQNREKKEKERQIEEEKKKAAENYPRPPEGMSPMKLGMSRNPEKSTVPITKHVAIPGGVFWMGSQIITPEGGKKAPPKGKDGAPARKKMRVKPFSIDIDVVTNAQFAEFTLATGYVTETEAFGWSFVLDSLASEDVVAEVDGETGYGRVKDAPHWMAVRGADWKHPNGPDSNIEGELLAQVPVLHVSYKDAEEYCSWAGGLRLPSEKEWEYAARGGRINETYPWGDTYIAGRMNIWDGEFPKENTLVDGYHGVAPVKSYLPNNYGLYNMLGNVWEWVAGGSPRERIMRGGSFVDSKDGSFNHATMVSSRHTNAADSAANNIGFRCASSSDDVERREQAESSSPSRRQKQQRGGGGGGVNPEDTVTIEL